MNRVILIGRLVRDPELRYTQGGSAVCTFTLAVDRGLSKQKKQEAEAQNKPTADFIRITVWGVQGENASKYLHKGSKCLIEGRIQTGSYEDNDGKTIYTTDVFADTVEFLDSRNQAQSYPQSKSYPQGGNYTGNSKNYGTSQNNADFFEDDFQEVQDDGRIPF